MNDIIKPIENPAATNIANILTIAEASYRWNVTENLIKSRLRTKNISEEKLNELRYLESIGYLKYFKPYEERNGKQARGTWLVSSNVMLLWFGNPVHTKLMQSL